MDTLHRRRWDGDEDGAARDARIERRALELAGTGLHWLDAVAQANREHEAAGGRGATVPRPAARKSPGKVARSMSLRGSVVHREATAGLVPADDGEVEDRLRAAQAASGAPLPAPLRTQLANVFGVDLDDVRIHTGPAAAAAAAAIAANAFTIGRDIHFAAGTYQPDTPDGQRLIAHEVAHAAVQPAATAPAGELRISDPSDASEHAADQLADAFVARTAATRAPVASSPAPAATVHRQPAPHTIVAGWKAGKGETLKADNLKPTERAGIVRIPLDNLAAVPGSKRAIVMVPKPLLTTAPTTIEALIHIYGFYTHGYQHLRDREIYRIDEQMAASGRKNLIGILPQGPENADTDHAAHDVKRHDGSYQSANMPKVPDANELIAEVAQRIFGKEVDVARVILSGHSGGGPNTMAAANAQMVRFSGPLGGLFLFDAIHGGELTIVQTFLTARLDSALTAIRSHRRNGKTPQEIVDLMRDEGFRFRGIFSSGYEPVYTLLRDHLDTWFRTNTKKINDPQVEQQLRENFYVAPTAITDKDKGPDAESAHEGTLAGRKDLETSLKALPP